MQNSFSVFSLYITQKYILQKHQSHKIVFKQVGPWYVSELINDKENYEKNYLNWNFTIILLHKDICNRYFLIHTILGIRGNFKTVVATTFKNLIRVVESFSKFCIVIV